MTEFDPAAHRMVPEQRWFEDFVLGERFVIPSRTMTSAVFAAFQTASGDTHPMHYDVEYCRARGMPNLLAHGFQTLIHTAPGAGLFPYMVEESLVGFLEQSSRFLKPVYADDTIYPALEVTELTPGRTTGVVTLRRTVFNQRRELVLEGTQKFLIRRRPATVVLARTTRRRFIRSPRRRAAGAAATPQAPRRPGSFHIDYQLELDRRLNGKFVRTGALEDAIGIARSAVENYRGCRSHMTAGRQDPRRSDRDRQRGDGSAQPVK